MSLLNKLKISWAIRKAKSFEKKGDYNASIKTYLAIDRLMDAMNVYTRAESNRHHDQINISTEYEVLSANDVNRNDIYKIINDRINPNGQSNLTLLYGNQIIAGDKSFIQENN